MQKTDGGFPWAVAWFVAAGLALLLFGVMSLLALGRARPSEASPQPALTGEVTGVAAADVTPGSTPASTGGAGAGMGPAGESEDGTPIPGTLPTAGLTAQAAPDPTATIGLWLSALSAITALVGLVSSLWLGWRKERREVAQHLLELERTQLEVAKLRRELETQRDSGQRGAKPQESE